MPIYEYECCSCRKVIEILQRISDKPLNRCPDCHGAVTKLVSMSAFHLKGGGWYADGYSNNTGNGGKSGAKKDGGGIEPKSPVVGKETKPDKKAGGNTKESTEKSPGTSAA